MAEQAEAIFQRAVRAYRDGAYDQARGDCQELLRLLPPHAGILGLLGAVELRRNDPDAAIAALAEATALAPGDPGILSNLGIAYRLTGKSERARQCLPAKAPLSAPRSPSPLPAITPSRAMAMTWPG